MKKFFTIVCFFILTSYCPCLANNCINDEYLQSYSTEFYEFNPKTNTCTLNKIANKKELKSYKKALNLYKKKKYREALIQDTYFLPALYALYNKNYVDDYYSAALSYLEKIRYRYPGFSPKYIKAQIVICRYLTSKYAEAIEMLSTMKEEFPLYNYYMMNCYFKLDEYKEAYKYANKIKSNDENYYEAQETIFKILYREKKLKEAYNIAYRLIKLEPENPKNYLRLCACTSDFSEKLKLLYKARNLTSDSMMYSINATIIRLEQDKIDAIAKKSKKFINVPNWLEILSQASDFGDTDYWLNRQDDFFKQTNKYISQYSGTELSNAFTALINKQMQMNQQLIQKEHVRRDNEYKQAVLEQNERMIRLQRMQEYNTYQQANYLYQINSYLRNGW